jgi:tetratricopeptide (TPR) repeat protein
MSSVIAARADDLADCFSIGNENYKTPDVFAQVAEQSCTRLIAVRSGKSLSTAYTARATWRHKQKNYDAALTDYDLALSLDPTDVEIYDYRADTLVAKGDLDGAIANYDRAIRVDPTYAAACFSRGSIYENGTATALPKTRASWASKLAATNGPEDRIQKWAQDNAAARLKALDSQ